MDIFFTDLSVYRNSFDTVGVVSNFGAVIERVQNGKRGLDEKTLKCNHLYENALDSYTAYKRANLPAVTFGGTFPPNKRKATHLLRHSGCVVLDIDGLLPSQIPDLLAALTQHPYVFFAFVSPSGLGIKVVVRVDPIPADAAEHKGAIAACTDHFGILADELDFKFDTIGSDVNRLCYLSHDPLAIVNPNAIPIFWDRDAWQEEQDRRRSDLESRKWDSADVDVSALYFIPNDCEYETWRNIGMGIKSSGLPVSVFEKWTGGQRKRSTGEWVSENIPAHWSRYNSNGITWGSVVFLAQQNGYELPKSDKKRYAVDAEHRYETSTIETERTANQNVLKEWLQDTENANGTNLLILGSAAGTGKTTAAITTAENLLYIAKTSEQADQVFQKLWDAEDDVYRHRPRLFNRDHPDWQTLSLGLNENDRPCILPELCNTYAERGHPTHEVCNRCPLHSECKTEGYLSQVDREKNAQKVVYAWDEAMVCDRIHEGRVKRICSNDDILILDEVNPANLTQRRHISRDTVLDLTDRFRDGNTLKEFETLKALLDLISTAEDGTAFIDGLWDWTDGIDEVEDLDDKIQKFPVGYVFHDAPADESYRFVATMDYSGKTVTVPVVSYETGVDTPVFEVDPDRPMLPDVWQHSFFSLGFLLKVGLVDPNDPPRRFKSFVSDLLVFFSENTHESGELDPDTAPFTFDPKLQSFEFYLKPTLNHRRVIFNTASDPDNLNSEVYRDTGVNITRHTGQTPAWKNPLVFQLSTGNYLPRQSLLRCDGDDLVLKPRAQEMVDRFILPTIKAGLKVLVVGPKAFQDVEFIRLLNCKLINHHHAEGRNDFQAFDVVFVFHYEPNRHEIVAIAKRTFRNQETPLGFTRERRTVTVGGVRFKKNVYVDARVQAVFNRECRARLMQSAMRLRPNIHDGKIIVFLTAEPVDIPVTPIPFSLSDGEGFTGDWHRFKRELQEKDTETDVKAVAERDGVSERTAYRRTQEAKKQSKAERDIEIVRRYADGQSKKRIATELGIGQGAVKRVLEKQSF